MAEPSANATLSAPQRSEGLAERLEAMALRIREQEEAARLSETELLAMERDLRVKDAYIRRLERAEQMLSVELAQVRERAAELFGDLERAEARLAEDAARLAERSAELEALRREAAYRLGTRLAAVARRLGPLAPLARRLVGGPSGRPGAPA